MKVAPDSARSDFFRLPSSSSPNSMRWRWMAGGAAAAGAAAAGAMNAEAGIVQITLSDNYVDLNQNRLDGDVTGDLINDLGTGISVTTYNPYTSKGQYSRASATSSRSFTSWRIKAWIRSASSGSQLGHVAGNTAYQITRFTTGATIQSTRSDAFALAGTGYSSYTNGLYWSGTFGTLARGFTAISFTDSSINNGAKTGAWLEIHSSLAALDEPSIRLVRLVFDSASTTRPPKAAINLDGTDPEYIPGTSTGGGSTAAPAPDPAVIVQQAKLSKQIKSLKSKVKKLKKKGNRTKSKKLAKKLKKLQKQLRAL